MQSDDLNKGDEIRRLHIDADTQNIKSVLDFIKSDMQRCGASQTAQFNMMIAAEEIFTNIAMYAYENTDGAYADICCKVADGIYYVTFIDGGKEYNPLLQDDPDVNMPLKDRKIGGFGVFLAKKMSDELTYRRENRQNILTVGMNIK